MLCARHKVDFAGRTDRAIIPSELNERLIDLFGNSDSEQLFEQLFGEREVILFGEGYGRKIQSVGSRYIPNGVNFILFDLLINDNYQPRESVERCAKAFGVPAVPVVGIGTLEDAVKFVEERHCSTLGDLDMEGVVCRPKHELKDRCGNRIIVKIKVKDFAFKEG